MLEARLRNSLHGDAMATRADKLPAPGDWDMQLTGPARLLKPDGRPLCVYLPRALHGRVEPAQYDVLHSLRRDLTDNRGLASGSLRLKGQQTRSRSRRVASSILGAVDPGGQQKYCRLTAWTGRHLPEWETLRPLLAEVSRLFAEHVPARYAAQQAEAARTDPAWVIEGTVFSTVTVNNSYATGVHTDKGDLDAGFSTIAVLRRGAYTGGLLVFPQYRVAADLGDGDVLLMDAHEWHGNTQLVCACGVPMNGVCTTCQAERISIVSYYRTKLAACGDPAAELARADRFHQH